MNWEEIKVNEQTREVAIPDNWLHVHYYEALNILFRFENSLRVFVYIILKKNLKENWDNTNINEKLTIRQKTKQRKNQDNDYGYLTYEINSPMLYLSSGELIDIIMYDKNWKYFNSYFKAKKDIIKHKLLEIGAIRNALAHFRPIDKEDLSVIKQNVKHTLLLVEKVLNKITNITMDVHTNDQSSWYKDLMNTKSEDLYISSYQDTEKDWIKVKLYFNLKILHTIYEFNSGKSYDVMNISSLNILRIFTKLRNNLIYINEDVTVYSDNSATKEVNLIFSRNTLEKNWGLIYEDIKQLVLTIENDVKLLEKDNLAQAILLNKKTASYRKKNNDYWVLNDKPFFESVENYDGVEFWGKNVYSFGDSFLTSEHWLPWMPVTISNNDSPF